MDALVSVVNANRMLVERGEAIGLADVEQQTLWLEDAGQSVTGWGQLRNLSTMMEAQILYTVYSVWPQSEDDLASSNFLRSETTLRWNGDFYEWARSVTQRGAREPANVTIANKVTVYRDWVVEDVIDVPDVVVVPLRDDKGNLVEVELDEEVGGAEVPFDPMTCDYGKLLVARGAARRGDMTSESWSALADPQATVVDLQVALGRGKKEGAEPKEDTLSVLYDHGIFYAKLDQKAVAFAMLISENLDDPLAQQALRYLLSVWGIPVPDDIEVTIEDLGAPLVSQNGAGLVLSYSGVRFLELTETDDILQVYWHAREVLQNRGVVDESGYPTKGN